MKGKDLTQAQKEGMQLQNLLGNNGMLRSDLNGEIMLLPKVDHISQNVAKRKWWVLW